MKKKIKTFCVFPLFFLLTQYSIAQNWFPMEVGNRWDYSIRVEGPGQTYYDTLSFEIIDQKVLSNGLEYFEFSTLLPFWPGSTQPRFVRETNNYIYYYDESDSSDCFAFRFDMPVDTFYYNCKNLNMNVWFFDSTSIFGQNDIIQDQMSGPITYTFSEKFGIYDFNDEFNIVRSYYDLEGCKISGIIYGNLLVVVDEKIKSAERFTLTQNYPNPFNPVTSIKYVVGSQSYITLKVYDVLGNEVATLVDDNKPSGNYEVEFNVTSHSGNVRNLPSGIYFYQLKANGFVETKKMILLK